MSLPVDVKTEDPSEPSYGQQPGLGWSTLSLLLPLIVMVIVIYAAPLLGMERVVPGLYERGVEGAVVIGMAIVSAALILSMVLVDNSASFTRWELEQRIAQVRDEADQYRQTVQEARSFAGGRTHASGGEPVRDD